MHCITTEGLILTIIGIVGIWLWIKTGEGQEWTCGSCATINAETDVCLYCGHKKGK